MSDELKELLELTKDIANKNICCKYSNFTVGAALVTEDNKVYLGCNIENHGIQSICAERVAFVKALTDGEQNFKYIFITGKNKDSDKFIKTLPCGYCRQFISEYTTSDFIIYSYDENEDKLYEFSIGELLPEGFEF